MRWTYSLATLFVTVALLTAPTLAQREKITVKLTQDDRALLTRVHSIDRFIETVETDKDALSTVLLNRTRKQAKREKTGRRSSSTRRIRDHSAALTRGTREGSKGARIQRAPQESRVYTEEVGGQTIAAEKLWIRNREDSARRLWRGGEQTPTERITRQQHWSALTSQGYAPLVATRARKARFRERPNVAMVRPGKGNWLRLGNVTLIV